MALATVTGLSFSYPGAAPALQNVSLELHPGERVALLGPSGSGKSTLLRALAGLVPHFYGGRFVGKVEVAGRDTRRVRPADLAGTVGSVFQDPEDQVVMTKVQNEVAFGLENLGVEPVDIWPRAEEALDALRAAHLAQRRTPTLSGGELQRVCLASALAQRPRLLLLDEPTSQLDPQAADRLISSVGELGCAFVLSEQRTMRALDVAERVLFLDRGRLLFDGPKPEALAWLSEYRPSYVDRSPTTLAGRLGSVVAELSEISFAYEPGAPVLERAELEVRRGEVVALEGPNGAGKTTLAKIAVGLLDPDSGSVLRRGRAGYLSQDPGRYLVCEHVLEEVALGVHGDVARARVWLERVGLGFAADRHPRDLSSGERERLGLAAVAVSEPDLLALDEPTRGVDPDRKAELGAWLAEYAAAGRGVLVATHDRTFPAHRRVSLAREEALVAA